MNIRLNTKEEDIKLAKFLIIENKKLLKNETDHRKKEIHKLNIKNQSNFLKKNTE